mmetsp:Transcript_16095/g.46950  ORF Transcript_16095/g.46950 Transcript_16095/m.46950 type:complete len:202 (-) Transcript_16095:222-827(-)
MLCMLSSRLRLKTPGGLCPVGAVAESLRWDGGCAAEGPRLALRSLRSFFGLMSTVGGGARGMPLSRVGLDLYSGTGGSEGPVEAEGEVKPEPGGLEGERGWYSLAVMAPDLPARTDDSIIESLRTFLGGSRDAGEASCSVSEYSGSCRRKKEMNLSISSSVRSSREETTRGLAVIWSLKEAWLSPFRRSWFTPGLTSTCTV